MKVRIYFLLLIGYFTPLSSFADPISLAILQAQAAKGDAQAELDLGRAYHLGKGVPQDFVKAAELYQEAAAQGNAKAMYNLGYIYQHGQGVTKDGVMAGQWFQKAANLGLASGQLEIGLSYFFGDDGFKQDYSSASKWLTQAAQQPDASAACASAANALGSLYEHGQGVPLDGKQAIFWYTTGAEMGNAKAQFNLGCVYNAGIHVGRDRVRSYKWLKLSALQGEPLATHLLTEFFAGKEFTAQEMADGDREVRKYQEAHHLPTNTTVTLALDPIVPPTAPPLNAAATSLNTPSQAMSPSLATNAASATIPSPSTGHK
jgi:TPR repeat protein